MGIFKRKQPQAFPGSCVYACLKDKCPKWKIMETRYWNPKTQQNTTETSGACSDVWLVTIAAQIREELTTIRMNLSGPFHGKQGD